MATSGNWKSRYDPDATQPGAFPPNPREYSMDALKGALQSKTVWLLGIVPGLLGIIDMLTSNSVITSAILALVPGFGPVLTFLGALAIFLRAITSKPLAEKGES